MISPLLTVESSTYAALINENEFLQIKQSKVAIISTRNGFCTYFYYLPHQPKDFSFSPDFADRYSVVYPSIGQRGEMLEVLETTTGRVIRSMQMKQGIQLTKPSIGAHLVFQETSNLHRVYYTVPGPNEGVYCFDLKSKVLCLGANRSMPQFVAYTENNFLVVVNLAQEASIAHNIPCNVHFSFIHLRGNVLTLGLHEGQLQVIKINEDKVESKMIDTPHQTKPIYFSNNIAVTRDGTAFSIDTGEIFETHFRAEKVSRNGSTLAIIGKTQTKLYEFIRKPVCTCSQFQPPEPFSSSTFCLEDLILFASGNHIFSFDLNNISKFATLYNAKRILKIQNSAALITVVYISNENTKRIQTLVAGANKRDEEGIDAATDNHHRTWILEKNRIIAFKKDLLSIQTVDSIDLPEDHPYSSIFRFRDGIALYSPEKGLAAFVQNGTLSTFNLPRNITIFAWPAVCTTDSIFIYSKEKEKVPVAQINHKDFIFIRDSISSCCWLGNTLFAVEGNRAISIHPDGSKNSILSLPNNMCHLSVVLPSQLIFVSTIPELNVIVEKFPVIFHILNDIDSKSPMFPFVLSELPRLKIPPRALNRTDHLARMSVYNKCPPSKVTNKVIQTYSRFGKFEELRQLAKTKKSLKQVADTCVKYGQFNTAMKIYTELNDYDGLFGIFIVCRNINNLKRMYHNVPIMRSALRHFGISVDLDSFARQNTFEYEPLPNLQLPPIKPLIQPQEFELSAGDDASEYGNVPIHMPAFDEPGDFGLYIHKPNNEEMQQVDDTINTFGAASQITEGTNENGALNGSNENEGQPIEVRENPVIDFNKDEKLELDAAFFNEEEDEMAEKQEVKPVLQFKFTPRKSATPGSINRFSLNLDDNKTQNGANECPESARTRTSVVFNLDAGISPSASAMQLDMFPNNQSTISSSISSSSFGNRRRRSTISNARKAFEFNIDDPNSTNSTPETSNEAFPKVSPLAVSDEKESPKNTEQTEQQDADASDPSKNYVSNMFMDII